MNTKTVFPIEKVQQLRDRAIKAREFEQMPQEGWSKSAVDPMRLLAVFSSLRMKDGYVLRAYQFREGGNGNGFVWAMPEKAPFPEPEECERVRGHFLEPPKPPGALDNFMEAIEGDGTPWSYLSASLFAREAREFGARWHGLSWSTHTILGSDPQYPWLEVHPEEWRPVVIEEKGSVTVSFYTYSGLETEAVYRHTDRYRAGNYAFKSEKTIIGKGPMGYIF
ncbi:hypothetical protein [Thermincola ferriacetica]